MHPFENHPLLMGQHNNGDALRVVGVYKGLIRVLDHEPTKEEAPFDLNLLLKPQSYKVPAEAQPMGGGGGRESEGRWSRSLGSTPPLS